MALTPRSGSSTTPSKPNATPGETTLTPADNLAHMPFISDSALNKFAIDTTQYADTTKQLIGFIKGKRVAVTYYRLLNREGLNNRTNVADLPNARHVNHTEYQKIIGLEITLSKEFDFVANEEAASVLITGQAMFYPNMNPNIGDMFLMGVGDGRIGLCRVTSVVPTTWRTDRIYMVTFVVPEFLEHAISDPLERSVSVTTYFTKENYLGGTAALLSEETYVQLAKIKNQRIILCQHFHQSFLDNNRNSYFHPDGTYDPWVVLFMCGKLRMDDVFYRPRNLLGQAKIDYQKTIWARLEDEYNNTLHLIDPCFHRRSYTQTKMGVFVTELTGRSIIIPTSRNSGAEDYLFSTNLYEAKTEEMSTEELLVFEAVTRKTSGPLSTLISEYLDPVFTLPKVQQFYKIPLYIHFIDMALRSQFRQIDASSMSYAQGEGD